MLKLTCRSYHYPSARQAAIREIKLEVAHGEAVGIVGPNDSGKSTLCLVASGLAPAVTGGAFDGSLEIDDIAMTGRPAHELVGLVGYGFQNPRAQISGMALDVREEVALAALNLGLSVAAVFERVDETLELLDIGHLAPRDPTHLSGGETQLVALASLVALQPEHLVLDEPTGELDPSGTRLVARALRRLADNGTALLIAEHKPDVIDGLCDRLIVLGDGTVIAEGLADDIYGNPDTPDLGVEVPARIRLARRFAAAGIPFMDDRLREALDVGRVST